MQFSAFLGRRHYRPPIVVCMATEEKERLRLGGMALRNGLLIHGPTHWAAAVRGPDGAIAGRLGAQARAGPEAGRAPARPARSAETRRGAGGAAAGAAPPAGGAAALRGPRGSWRRSAATLVATTALRKRFGRPRPCARGSCRRSAPRPAWSRCSTATWPPTTGSSTRRSPPTSRGSTTRPAVPKEHDRCGSNLIAPMMVLSVAGTVLLERLVEQPGPLARAARRPRRRLARGRDVRLERPPPRRAAGRGVPHARAGDPAPPRHQGADARSSSRSASPPWPRSSAPRTPARSDCRRPRRLPPCSEGSTTSASPSRTSTRPWSSTREPSRWSWPTARRSRSRGSRRCCSTSATATSSCCAPLGPDTPVGKFLAKRGRRPAPRRLRGRGHRRDPGAARRGRPRADRHRGPGRHRRQPRRLPAAPLHRRAY